MAGTSLLKCHASISRGELETHIPELSFGEPERIQIVLHRAPKEALKRIAVFRNETCAFYFSPFRISGQEMLMAFDRNVMSGASIKPLFESGLGDQLRAAFRAAQSRHDRLIERLLNEAECRGIPREEMNTFTLDGFGDKTHSSRIMALVTLAYYRGMARGVRMVEEMSYPIAPRLQQRIPESEVILS